MHQPPQYQKAGQEDQTVGQQVTQFVKGVTNYIANANDSLTLDNLLELITLILGVSDAYKAEEVEGASTEKLNALPWLLYKHTKENQADAYYDTTQLQIILATILYYLYRADMKNASDYTAVIQNFLLVEMVDQRESFIKIPRRPEKLSRKTLGAFMSAKPSRDETLSPADLFENLIVVATLAHINFVYEWPKRIQFLVFLHYQYGKAFDFSPLCPPDQARSFTTNPQKKVLQLEAKSNPFAPVTFDVHQKFLQKMAHGQKLGRTSLRAYLIAMLRKKPTVDDTSTSQTILLQTHGSELIQQAFCSSKNGLTACIFYLFLLDTLLKARQAAFAEDHTKEPTETIDCIQMLLNQAKSFEHQWKGETSTCHAGTQQTLNQVRLLPALSVFQAAPADTGAVATQHQPTHTAT